MGFTIPDKLSSVVLDCVSADSIDYVKKPFYIMNMDVSHDVGIIPVYYVGGSWLSYSRRVWFQPTSGGGSITLNGFFNNLANYTETYGYVTDSSQINPISGITPTDLDLRINGKQYGKCYCVHHSLRSQLAGENNIIYGTVVYRFSTIEDYP